MTTKEPTKDVAGSTDAAATTIATATATATATAIATRGSALAMAQARMVLACCEARFPDRRFELKVIKTTGDRHQDASLSGSAGKLAKGLFTKELESALLDGDAALAVHSLKDLPTELPDGLILAAVLPRADVRDVLLYRSSRDHHTPRLDPPPGIEFGRRYGPGLQIEDLPSDAVVATSSVRRKLQLLARRPDLRVVEIRGNVGTRIQKLLESNEIDATILAMAGLSRLGFRVEGSELLGSNAPDGVMATVLKPSVMLPAVGQGAIGIEIRDGDANAKEICRELNDEATWQCVSVERQFLHAMGGGCASPVAAMAVREGDAVRLRALVPDGAEVATAELTEPVDQLERLGVRLAEHLKKVPTG